MTIEEVYEYTYSTAEVYSNAVKAKIASSMLVDGVTTKKKAEAGNKIYVGDRGDENTLIYCLKHNLEQITKYIELWEFIKNYKYSILFELPNGFDIGEKISELINTNVITEYNRSASVRQLNSTIMCPEKYENENAYYLKFLTKLEGIDSRGARRKKRNAAVIRIYKDLNVVEIRFDAIENYFDINKSTYINDIIAWMRTYISNDITAFDVYDVLDYIKENGKSDGVIPSWQSMKMSNGSEATIGIGNKGNLELPFIDEMKAMLREYNEELDNSPHFKAAFEEYINDRAESEYPIIEFLFMNRRIEVKFIKEYDGNDWCLMQHCASNLQPNIGEERMCYVTRYIIDVARRISE